jgi:dTDP-4-amino-4,6-dideoxygalactose transaminase
MIKIIEPYFSFDDIEADFKKIFSSGVFTKGKYNIELRKQLCQFTNNQNSYLTTSATTALYMSLMALNLPRGSLVGVSDFTWPASAYVIVQAGLKPIMVDVDVDTFNVSIDTLSEVEEDIKALIFVDALGNTSNIDEIYSYCIENDIFLIEDAACSFGSKVNEKNIGSYSDVSCVSFHPRKLLNSGEGGCIVTNNEKLSEVLEIQLNVGASLSSNKLFPDFVDMGYNYRLPELQCAMISHQIKIIESIVLSRHKIYAEYCNSLLPLGFKSQKFNTNTLSNIQSAVFVVPETIKRDELIIFLRDRGVESILGTYSLSIQPYFKENFFSAPLKNSVYLQENTISLPCHDNFDISIVIDAIKEFAQGCLE